MLQHTLQDVATFGQDVPYDVAWACNIFSGSHHRPLRQWLLKAFPKRMQAA